MLNTVCAKPFVKFSVLLYSFFLCSIFVTDSLRTRSISFLSSKNYLIAYGCYDLLF